MGDLRGGFRIVTADAVDLIQFRAQHLLVAQRDFIDTNGDVLAGSSAAVRCEAGTRRHRMSLETLLRSSSGIQLRTSGAHTGIPLQLDYVAVGRTHRPVASGVPRVSARESRPIDRPSPSVQIPCTNVRRGIVWTTDAPYRETKTQLQEWAKEGVLAVEMQAASLFAFGTARDVAVGSVAM